MRMGTLLLIGLATALMIALGESLIIWGVGNIAILFLGLNFTFTYSMAIGVTILMTVLHLIIRALFK